MTGRIVMALFAGWVLAQGAHAAEATVEAGVFSKYVWRGQVLNEDPVVQSSLNVDAGNGLSFMTWANFDLTDANTTELQDTKNAFTEVDFYLEYALPLDGPIGASAGYVEYLYPQGEASTREVYAILTLAGLLSPTLSLFYDFGTVDGLYSVLDFSHDFELSETVVLTTGVSVGGASDSYNESVYGVDRTLLNDGNGYLTADWALSKTLTLTGLLQYSAQLDGEIRDAIEAEDGDPDALFGGVKLSVVF
jgi:uncharacterized protein (TIGR02001 family)